MAVSVLLCGCGQQTENQADNLQNSQEVQETNASIGPESLFKGTIFDDLVLEETSSTDIETILEERFLEYEDEDIVSDEYNFVTSLAGKTTITDSFYEWNVLYKYILNDSVGRRDKEDYYSDDLAQGEVIYYPVEKMTLYDTDYIKYIMLGKYANCDREEAKHTIKIQ